MIEKVSFFLPVRSGSQRVLQKSTRKFSTFEGGLLELKLKQLLESNYISEIVLSTNDPLAIEIAYSIDPAEEYIKAIIRPEDLCLDSTSLSSLIQYVPTVVNSPHVLWGHVTTPFVTPADYDQAILSYFKNLENGYDSLVSVSPFQNFLLDKEGRIFNKHHISEKWPRTQDLEILFEINHAIFLTSVKIYHEKKNRLGASPYMLSMNKVKSWDIDWEDDFQIAEAIYEKLI